MTDHHTHILGSKLSLISKNDMSYLFSKWLKNAQTLMHIITLNPEICLRAQADESYREIIKDSALSVADGIGLLAAARLLGTEPVHRITGREVVDELCLRCVNQNKSLFLLGGKDNIALQAAGRLRQKFPGLKIAGAEEGISPEQFSLNTPELIRRINNSGAEALLVAFGAPKQEQWICHNRKKLPNVKIAAGIGGIFDYLAGKVKEPPDIIINLGLEWLFRLATQSGRYRRIFRAVLVFPWQIIKWRLRMMFVYRKNVVAVILDNSNRILLVSPSWSKIKQWQFPQGGVDSGENPARAVLREMTEELGTDKFTILTHDEDVYRYVWPKWYRIHRGYRGQKQDLYIMRFTGSDRDIKIEKNELSDWKWADQPNFIEEMAEVRKSIGRIALEKLGQLE